jgi:diguanylate cyclase (GGDEF)-like protein
VATDAVGSRHLPGRVLRMRPGTRVCVLAAGLALTALATYMTAIRGASAVPGPFHLSWWFLVPVFLIAEGYPVHVHFRRETHSLSMSDFALVIALFLAPPSHLLFAQLIGGAVAVTFIRRQRPLKIAFNLAQFGFTGCLAILVFRTFVGGHSPYGIAGWVGALAAAGVAAVAGVMLVAVAIRLTDSGAHLREMPFVAAVGLTSAITSASLGLAVLELLRADARAVWLLAVPVGMSALAFHAYTRQRRRRQHLEFLYSSMRTMQTMPNLQAAIRELLQAAQKMVSAELGELILLPRSPDEPALRSVIDPRGERLLEPVGLSPAAELALRGASLSDKAILLPRRRESHVLDAYLTELGVADAVVSAIRSDQGVTGMLLLGDRSGDVVTFTIDDRKLLETFANHAGVLLENDQVREQLQYQAFHDALTGLPNRVLFTEKVARALAEMPAAVPIVLFLDLDDFKTINDSLGHGAGDELLVAVAERVRRCAGTRGVAARLGGDEFGILLPDASMEEATRLAADLLDAFRGAVTLAGREISVHPSIGIANAEQQAATADELLRNADVAMYSAKGNGKHRAAVYQPEMHERAKHRQELASALERAVERDEIRVHYQPIVELATGAVVAFEALARWQHPDHGLLSPGSFIPLAEETGIATAIGRIVRREATKQLALWRDAYPGSSLISITANASPPELQNARLVDDVAEALRDASLDSGSLVLEITESSAFREPEVTIQRLRELRELGVRVALDDFGTGYSSLSHLRDLPIDFVKIAKPFVDGLVGSPTAETFVKAILQIAKALDLAVIAEGIEHNEQLLILKALDCEFGQGYLYSRPLAAEEAEAYLRSTMQHEWRSARDRRRIDAELVGRVHPLVASKP